MDCNDRWCAVASLGSLFTGCTYIHKNRYRKRKTKQKNGGNRRTKEKKNIAKV